AGHYNQKKNIPSITSFASVPGAERSPSGIAAAITGATSDEPKDQAMPSRSSHPDLRSMLVPGAALLLPGVSNALAARVVADLGFAAAYVTGAGIANTFLGIPDNGLVTATELVEHVAAIRDVFPGPLVVDMDTGFGNALNTVRSVRALERAGANALQIEDQVFPKRCGHFSGKQVIPAAEM